MNEFEDRIAGVLLGTAAGDALGAGYEFTHPGPDRPIEMIGGGLGNFAPGEWTDDTSMALAIALAADTDPPGLDLDVVAANFVRWYDSQPPDIGVQTAKVLSVRPESAEAMWRQSMAIEGRTGGNGSLMRTAPVALVHLDSAADCARVAGQVSMLTHRDPQAEQACRIWSLAIRHAVHAGDFQGVRAAVATLDTADTWHRLLDEAETLSPQHFPNNGWVVHALQTAWWAITHAPATGPEHLPAALELCVRAGGDTDTTAAIAGGLLGARWGASAVPAEWRAMLHGYPGLTGEDLVDLALRITRADRRQPTNG
ncbi:ADP-ribosylglycohydrolase family protein [Nocardia farcinica]|uniref:Putative ribosylglycohydrolase n=1 Tax=Nocardia farcinica (strain IFM 10152) TaxID=247156 RepID=Q5YYW3_NOCFA|nr:ADP-ribosylglycohydrolase family protein [Nocardia farcinica]BAD56628.1 putative ribosylglycohydrolase [Nocardia farcinica IFM 10152]